MLLFQELLREGFEILALDESGAPTMESRNSVPRSDWSSLGVLAQM
jgi:hypothetical protein